MHYWREAAPARDLFELPQWSGMAESLVNARLIYFTGITLSLYSNVGLGRFLATIELARGNGAKIAFDGNFRPHGWHGDLTRTRTVFAEALKRVDIALPAYDDEAVLWGDPSPEATIERLQAFGVNEIVVKNGPNSALVAAAGARDAVPVPEVVVPVDPTAAGDGFNAGYLAARLDGRGPDRSGERRAQARRASDPPSRRDHAARRRGGALNEEVNPMTQKTIAGLAVIVALLALGAGTALAAPMMCSGEQKTCIAVCQKNPAPVGGGLHQRLPRPVQLLQAYRLLGQRHQPLLRPVAAVAAR